MSLVEPTQTRPTAIVTGGAGGGIGHGITEVLAAAGWAVVIVDIDERRTMALSEKLNQGGAQTTPVILNITAEGTPERCVEVALEKYGRLDGLVNSAGIGLTKSAGDVQDDEFYRLFNMDFMASFRFVRAALPALRKSAGSIVNIGSIHARLNSPKYALYAATKSALDAFTRGLAVDYGRDGVRANNVHPGLVESPQNEALLANLVPNPREWMDNFAIERQCIPRLATSHEVGELVAFLLGDKSRCITGQSIFIDGGTTSLLWNNER